MCCLKKFFFDAFLSETRFYPKNNQLGVLSFGEEPASACPGSNSGESCAL